MTPKRAMVLAAGHGRRMRPLSATTPKPLISVAGKALLDHCLDDLCACGVETAIVNVHYLADQVEAHLSHRQTPHIIISDERAELLNTGGGIARALPHLGEQPFFLRNSDSFWLDGVQPNLQRLTDGWDDDRMDCLLLLAATVNSAGYAGSGDFNLNKEGRLSRRVGRTVAPFVYAGAAILHPRLFTDAPDGAFSLNLQFDRAIDEQRLFGVPLDGLWINVESPEAINMAETAIAESAA